MWSFETKAMQVRRHGGRRRSTTINQSETSRMVGSKTGGGMVRGNGVGVRWEGDEAHVHHGGVGTLRCADAAGTCIYIWGSGLPRWAVTYGFSRRWAEA